MYGEFTWWSGVVEDRFDPLKLGRCRVRILGYHTDNKQKDLGIPTEDLPWANPMQPITSGAMSGVGTTPMGPVEGSWVFGFFRDGKSNQDPVMIGTIGGFPQKGPNPTLGFNDPNGLYPQDEYLKEQDTNRLARGIGANPVGDKDGENAASLQNKRKTRQMEVPVAVAGDMSKASGGDTIENTSNTGLYEKADWYEPNPRYGGVGESETDYVKPPAKLADGKLDPEDGMITSLYPYNHVRQGESGHVEEWDDTPSAERLHTYHMSGTFEEIQPDGTRVKKVIGSDYEITLGLKDVLIQGTCNVTIKGDCRMLYQGDLVQEVYGDYHLNVHKDFRTKVLHNQITEVGADPTGDRKTVVNGEDDLFVGKNRIINVSDNLTETVGNDMLQTIKNNVTETYGGKKKEGINSHVVNLDGKSFYSATETLSIQSVDNMKLSTLKDLNINVKENCLIDINGHKKEDVKEFSELEIGMETANYSTVKIGGYSEWECGEYSTIDIGQYLEEDVGGYDNHVVGGYYIMSNDGTHQISSGGNYSVVAPKIDLN